MQVIYPVLKMRMPYNISGAAAVSDAHKEADLDLKEYSAQTDEESSLNNLSDRNDSAANGDENKGSYVFSGDTETSEELAGNKKSAYEPGYHKPGFADEFEYDENDLVAEIMNTGSESLSDVVKKLENDIAFKDLESSVDSQAKFQILLRTIILHSDGLKLLNHIMSLILCLEYRGKEFQTIGTEKIMMINPMNSFVCLTNPELV